MDSQVTGGSMRNHMILNAISTCMQFHTYMYVSDTFIMETPRSLTDCIINKEKTLDTATWLAQLVERRTAVGG